MRVAVLEPVALYREVLHWHLNELASEVDEVEIIDDPSQADLVLTWTQPVGLRPALSVMENPDPGAVGKLLREVLMHPTPVKRAWKAPTISPEQPSRQELIILRCIAAGLTTSEIGSRFGISPHTVNGHRRRLFRRWGVHSAVDAVALARKHHFLETSTASG